MDKEEIINTLRRELEAATAQRRAAKNSPATQAARVAVRLFQADRLARTHADLLAAPETGAAARFFLTDLYGPDDLTQRDAELDRIIPTMSRLLPAAALATIAEAVALDALSERLDAAMGERLGEKFGEDDYIDAYRHIGTRADRERQLTLVESVGNSLCDLVDIPLVGGTLALMRRPAKLARLHELQNFLERGYDAFKGMKTPRDFVVTVIGRERKILQRLYDGEKRPFAL